MVEKKHQKKMQKVIKQQMNTGLMEENYEALSRYRLNRAHETLSEIPYLREQGYYNTATNRLYYALLEQK